MRIQQHSCKKDSVKAALPPCKGFLIPLVKKKRKEVHTMLAERAATWKDMYIQEGLAEGILKGRSEGLVQGRSEGRIRALAESIRAMTTALGLSEDRACEILNVSEDDKKALALLLKQQPAPLPE